MEISRLNEFDTLNLTEQELDRLLESDAGTQMRDFVRSMPDETVSMAWRSELNQKISAHVRSQEKKRRFAWIVSPALGLGLAGALAFVFIFKSSSVSDNPSVVRDSKLEERLVASFEDNLRNYDMTGVGLSPDEVVSRRTNQGYDIIEVGFDAP